MVAGGVDDPGDLDVQSTRRVAAFAKAALAGTAEAAEFVVVDLDREGRKRDRPRPAEAHVPLDALSDHVLIVIVLVIAPGNRKQSPAPILDANNRIGQRDIAGMEDVARTVEKLRLSVANLQAKVPKVDDVNLRSRRGVEAGRDRIFVEGNGIAKVDAAGVGQVQPLVSDITVTFDAPRPRVDFPARTDRGTLEVILDEVAGAFAAIAAWRKSHAQSAPTIKLLTRTTQVPSERSAE